MMDSIQPRTALIAGSTGLVGQELLKLLINDSSYEKVISLVRKSTGQNHPKVRELIINFDELPSCLAEIKSCDNLFICLGTTIKTVGGSKAAFYKVDHDYPVAIAKWGETVGVKKILIVSAMGANVKSSIFYSKTKGEMETDISKLKIPSITFFRPSLLMGDRKENRTGEKIGIVIFKALSFLFVGPLKDYKGIKVTSVAKAMIETSRKAEKGVVVVSNKDMVD